MRDFVVIILVFALVVAGYFGYKQVFGEEKAAAEVKSAPRAVPNMPVPVTRPVVQKQPVQPPAEPQVTDPVTDAEQRVSAGQSHDMAADLFRLACDAASKGQSEKSLTYMQRIYSGYAESPYAHQAAAALAEQELSSGRKWEARNLLSFAYERVSNVQMRKSYAARMEDINTDLVWGPAGSKDSVIYQVQPGDYLSKLAAKFNCPYRLIMKINGIKDPRKLRVGQRLKILASASGGPMRMSILVDKSEFRLSVYLNGHFLREYHVGIGQHDFTPAGEFIIGERLEKPEYRGIKHGDPKNILGDYWITLENDNYPGLGIHGTTEPESIGTKSSLGCIRMRNEEVGELYRIVPKGTKVTIRE